MFGHSQHGDAHRLLDCLAGTADPLLRVRGLAWGLFGWQEGKDETGRDFCVRGAGQRSREGKGRAVEGEMETLSLGAG